MPVEGVKVPPDPETTVGATVKLRVLDAPSRVPAVLVQVPEKVWIHPAPRFRVPPFPLIVRPPPLTGPVRVAMAPVLVIETTPVVEKPAILCVPVPLIVTGEALAVIVPLLTKFPPKVIA